MRLPRHTGLTRTVHAASRRIAAANLRSRALSRMRRRRY